MWIYVVYSQGPETLHNSTPKMYVTFFTPWGGKTVVICTQHHQPATTTEQYSPPLITSPAFACPVTFLGDTYLSWAWTRETRCIPCWHMYSINWRHCTKKTKDQGMLFSRSALLPRSLRRMVKNIEINPWNTWKNHEKSYCSNPFVPALHNIFHSDQNIFFYTLHTSMCNPHAELPTHPHPQFLEMRPRCSKSEIHAFQVLGTANSSKCEPSFQGFKPHCRFQPRRSPKPSQTRTLWKPAVVRNEKPWFQDWHAWAPTFRNPQCFEIGTRTFNSY